MSRETYFRAWDKVTKRYYVVSGLEYDESGELCEIYLAGIELDESDPNANVRKPSEVILEQDTGLKDKNGKKICEGDIIQEEIDFNSKMTDGTFRYRVYWDGEELCWCLEHIGNESIHHELWQCNQSTEVIGNIHESDMEEK